ncbi:MAG: HAMP domain-containing histidine kinase [Burkholderiales bacterium]|nr:HAMP domain-containing histidine kinase [Burkholderiales bacterium]
MFRAGRPATLARHYLRWLSALFVGWTVSIFAAVLGFVMLPLAERSADDLAGLMVLSAQTWVELPPDTRPAFEAELLRKHQLVLSPGRPMPRDVDLVHGFYVYFLEQSLQQRAGLPAYLAWAPGPEPGRWLWTTVKAGGQDMGVGFSDERLNTRPLWGLAVVLLVGTAQAGLAAWWLARRISQPVARLEQAAADLASGARPALLPITGPRELAELSGHFNQMVLQVRELLDARTTLLAGISHDLRTPLARMRLALELLTVDPRPDLITRLERDVDEMNSLIGQLLDLARGLEHEPARTLELEPWLLERAARHAEVARTAGAVITVTCPADLQVSGAAGLLGRVVDNLLGNALRYAPGPIELVAQMEPTAAARHVRLSVFDRGPGIAADQMDTVWRPFQRVEGSRSPRTGGYGLGLAIVKQLATSQGWAVGMAARDGGGLVSWVELPALELADEPLSGSGDAVG